MLMFLVLLGVIFIIIAVKVDKAVRVKKEAEERRARYRMQAEQPQIPPRRVAVSTSEDFSCEEERMVNKRFRAFVTQENDTIQRQAYYNYLRNKQEAFRMAGCFDQSTELTSEVERARVAVISLDTPLQAFSSPLVDLLCGSPELRQSFQMMKDSLAELRLVDRNTDDNDILSKFFCGDNITVIDSPEGVQLVFTPGYLLYVGSLAENIHLFPYTEVKLIARKQKEMLDRGAYPGEEVAEVHYRYETKTGDRDMRYSYINNPKTTWIYRGIVSIYISGLKSVDFTLTTGKQAERIADIFACYKKLVIGKPHDNTVKIGLENPEKLELVLEKYKQERSALSSKDSLPANPGGEQDAPISTFSACSVSSEEFKIQDGVLVEWQCSSKKYEIQEGLFQEIGEYSVLGDELEELVIPEGVRILHRHAFSRCISLRKVIFPDSLELVREWAFSGCENLETVIFGKCLRELGEWAFSSCKNLSTVILPDSLSIIGKWAFSGCESLKEVKLPQKLQKLGDDVFYESGLESVTLPNEVENMGSGILSRCNSLKEVVLGENIREIPAFFFHELKALERVIVHRPIDCVGTRAFENCSRFQGFQFDCDQGDLQEASMNFPKGLKSIGAQAFSGCGRLKSVRFPMSLLEIGERAFMNCSSLQKVEGLEENQWMGKRVFFKTPWLASLAQNGFVVIEDFLEAYVGQSENIEIPAGVKEIGARAFENNRRIESVVIPEGVVSIGNRAFGACKKLSFVQIPDSVTQIAGNAFATCPKLTIFCYRGSAASTYRIAHKIPGEYLARERKRSSTHSQTAPEPSRTHEKKEVTSVFKTVTSVSDSLEANPNPQTGVDVLSPEERKLIIDLRRKKREEQSKLGVDPTKDRPFEETGFQPDRVSLVLQNSNCVITSNLVVLRFVQSKPVGLFHPAEYEVFFADRNGRIISDVKTVKADIREGDLFHKITLNLVPQRSPIKEKSCELILRYPGADHNAACKIPFQMNLSFVSNFDF